MGPPDPGPYRFNLTPWTKELHDLSCSWACRKGAQTGITETALNRTFFSIDHMRRAVLYLLPTTRPDAVDFSSSRFGVALEQSEHINNIFSETNNIGHKRAGAVSLYIRGMSSRSAVKSVPVGMLVMDERDEMTDELVQLAWERISGHSNGQVLEISTPSIPEYGIDKSYTEGTCEEFFFRCPRCNKLISIKWPDNFEICGEYTADPRTAQSRRFCTECKGTLDREPNGGDDVSYAMLNGIWVPQFENRTIRTFGINQLYSAKVSSQDIAKLAIKSDSDPIAATEFHNSKIGVPYILDGARLDDTMINQCLGIIEAHNRNKITTLGIDVGSWLHCSAVEWTPMRTMYGTDYNEMFDGRLIEYCKLKNFEALDQLVQRLNPHKIVIDANPETREAKRFAQRYHGNVYLCYYAAHMYDKTPQPDEENLLVSVHRASWLDATLGRIRNNTMRLPITLDQEYRRHLKALVRTYHTNKLGITLVAYKNVDEDHYAHSLNYAEIALNLVRSYGEHTDISG